MAEVVRDRGRVAVIGSLGGKNLYDFYCQHSSSKMGFAAIKHELSRRLGRGRRKKTRACRFVARLAGVGDGPFTGIRLFVIEFLV